MSNFPIPTITCFDSSTLRVRGVVAKPGMAYEILVRGSSTGGSTACSSVPVSNGRPSNATLTFNGAQNVWIRWVGDTEYSMDAGDSAHNYTFKGTDPHNSLVSLISAIPSTYAAERASHVQDVHSVLGKFSLDIGGKSQNNVNTPTDSLLSSYQVDTGNPYLEWITFNYGRYMLFSSARGILPANLQGKWAYDSNAPWSAGE
jgi:alpha-L-fucosidase 2